MVKTRLERIRDLDVRVLRVGALPSAAGWFNFLQVCVQDMDHGSSRLRVRE